MPDTLLLDTETCDLCLDVFGNIAVATEPYALAQDAASAIKTFLGECYYDTTVGVPLFYQILSARPPLSLVKTNFNNAAMTVPNVASAQTFISALGSDRVLRGQVQISDIAGNISAASF